MGERCDNFSHAFNGMALDWGQVLGARFEDAPKHWVSVFRETSLDELLYIAREGLSAYHQEVRHPDMLQEMELLDSFRTEKVLKRGISRLEAIAAMPSDDHDFGYGHRTVTLEMKVDPKDCFVVDIDYLHYAMPYGGSRRAGTGEKYRAAFTKYWDSITPFTSFLKYYTKVELPEGHHWLKKSGAPRLLPDAFFDPEVLVMTPSVSSQHMRIVATPHLSHGYGEHEHYEAGI
jgi:hypothetical protein